MTNKSNRVPKIFSTTNQSEKVSIYLSDSISGPEDYTEELQVLKEAKETDVIYIYINNGGGQVGTALQIVNNILNCKATVIGCIEGECHSAASYIFLACDEWEVNPHSLMLIHNYSAGHYGKGSDLIQATQKTHDWILSIMKDIYIPFLSEDELSLVENKDMWLLTEEIESRLDRVREHRAFEQELMREEQLTVAKETIKGFISNEKQDSERVERGTPE
jgi:ATP-dependent protease ClpP protease subunit